MESVPEFAILFEEISGRNLLHSLSFAPHVLYSPFHLAFLLCVVPYSKYSCRTASLLGLFFSFSLSPYIFVCFLKMVSGAILFLKLLHFATEGKHSHAVFFPESFTFFLPSSLSKINYTVPA